MTTNYIPVLLLVAFVALIISVMSIILSNRRLWMYSPYVQAVRRRSIMLGRRPYDLWRRRRYWRNV